MRNNTVLTTKTLKKITTIRYQHFSLDYLIAASSTIPILLDVCKLKQIYDRCINVGLIDIKEHCFFFLL